MMYMIIIFISIIYFIRNLGFYLIDRNKVITDSFSIEI